MICIAVHVFEHRGRKAGSYIYACKVLPHRSLLVDPFAITAVPDMWRAGHCCRRFVNNERKQFPVSRKQMIHTLNAEPFASLCSQICNGILRCTCTIGVCMTVDAELCGEAGNVCCETLYNDVW